MLVEAIKFYGDGLKQGFDWREDFLIELKRGRSNVYPIFGLNLEEKNTRNAIGWKQSADLVVTGVHEGRGLCALKK